MEGFWLGFAVCYLLGAALEARSVGNAERRGVFGADGVPFSLIVLIALSWPLNLWKQGDDQ